MTGMTDNVRRSVKERIQNLGTSQNRVAGELGIEPVNLSRMLSGRSGALPKNWQALLDHLGLELVVKVKGGGDA